MKIHKNEITKSLQSTFKNQDVIELFTDYSEITIDLIIDNDVVENIPIVGTLRKIYGLGRSIQDHIFLKKLFRFIYSVGELSDDEVHEMSQKIDSSDKYRNKVVDNLIELIDKCDDAEKPAYLAKIFKAYIKGRVPIDKFFRYSKIVNNSYLSDLSLLRTLRNNLSIKNIDYSALLALGLVEVKTIQNTGVVNMRQQAAENQIEFAINSLGNELHDILFY